MLAESEIVERRNARGMVTEELGLLLKLCEKGNSNLKVLGWIADICGVPFHMHWFERYSFDAAPHCSHFWGDSPPPYPPKWLGNSLFLRKRRQSFFWLASRGGLKACEHCS